MNANATMVALSGCKRRGLKGKPIAELLQNVQGFPKLIRPRLGANHEPGAAGSSSDAQAGSPSDAHLISVELMPEGVSHGGMVIMWSMRVHIAG